MSSFVNSMNLTNFKKNLSNLQTKTKTFSLSLIKNSNSRHLRRLSKKKRKSTTNNLRIISGEYTTKIYVGNPPQEIHVSLDTGSSLFHIASKRCKICKQCKNHNLFNSIKSKTLQPTNNKHFKQLYGLGWLKANFVFDTVSINNISINNQKFGLVYKQKYVLDEVGGIIGLAFPRHHMPECNLFQNMVNQKLLKKNIIGYYIGPNGGSIQFGYIDHNLYHGLLNKHEIIEKNYRWTLRIDDIIINGKKMNVCGKKGCKGIVDTGSSDLTLPTHIFKKIEKYVKDFKNCEDRRNFNQLTYIINDIKYDIDTSNLFEKYTNDKGNVECDPYISPFDLDKDDEIWLIGEPFIKKYYTVFDRDSEAIHFALRK